jgi:hypothetical protein
MKLLIPYIGEVRDLDARMVRLADFLGIPCETLALADVTEPAAFLEKMVPDQCSCLVVNPQVMKEWVGPKGIPMGLAALLSAKFKYLLVHGLRVTAFDSELVAALSEGRLQSVSAVGETCATYVVAKDSTGVCEAFAGLSFGFVNPANDHVISLNSSDKAVRSLISIGGEPFMALVRLEGAEVFFIASEDVADVANEVGDADLFEYFSRFLPHAMALRYVAGEQCWRPGKAHASIIIDDPLLRKSYGFLDFDSLLLLANQHNFHVAIAFIPHNFRRNSPRITCMFRDNGPRLSICFHGNDHTSGELAATDAALLNTMLGIAEHRMHSQHQRTGLPCDRVMVFPQGRFSEEAMKALKAHNFSAAVNTVPYPMHKPVRLTIGELSQPAVLRYGGFPLFLRRSIRQTQSHDIAFNVFFGKPTLIVEHHDIFRCPDALAEIAGRINSVAPEVQWSNLATAVSNSILRRIAPDGEHQVRAYSSTVELSNPSDSIKPISLEWDAPAVSAVEQVLMNEVPCTNFQVDDAGVRLWVHLPPGESKTFRLAFPNERATVTTLGLPWNARAFVRRRLSEARDNYLSKNQRLLSAVKTIQRLVTF